ncbi:MAG TPA: hypothetical protein VGP68_18315 [Gemmataceae bacterium]|jgi:hypothetical protein|nr:hypothetical protein [Gemmataceae bacterium]
MGKTLSSLVLFSLGVATLFLSGGTCAGADGGWLGIRNDTNGPIVVQGVSIINRVPRQGPRHVLQPGQESWDVMIAPGNKMIIIADAKQPTRTLLQQTVNYAGADLFYSVQPDPNGAAANPNGPRNGFAVSKVKITTAKPTTTPPPGGGLGVAPKRR